ncbi:MAG: helix-turn-helix domain-containing protein [Lachnospiraceae bacterium]|nr:helix-turn-helix domain-containing protein [Lachnospiraceae bacterium]
MNKLKELRKAKGLKQKDLAEYLGITQQAYQKYEYGTSEMSGSTITKLAEFYGVTTDSLLGMPPKEPTEMELLEAQFTMTPLERKIMEAYFKLPPKAREDFYEHLVQIVNECERHKGGED